MTLLTKAILVAIGFWFFNLIVLFLFPVLPGIAGFAIPLSLPIAVILLLLTLIALIREKRKLGPVLSFILIFTVLYLAFRHVMYWGALGHLYLNKAAYEETAQRMLAARDDAQRRWICGERCWLVSQEHGRVAFHYVHGFLNWHDIVYDPSGRIVALESWDERRRFDTYFISAEHLTGDWYLAHFGD